MSRHERFVIISILSIVAVMVSFDLFTDSEEGVAVWHVLVEGGAGLAALLGIFFLCKTLST